ncbi:hypothetical protein TIFTF001_045529 [Ficus carica]|uniref:Uncharacterized protein n=1 Tax=Ficus carica TaxID=3494 RepID=A0AA87Z979_FICCA|nr:hypothetical protein TIFTF001_045529 [Ficus carica]
MRCHPPRVAGLRWSLCLLLLTTSPGQGGTTDGHPPSGVAPAVISPRYPLARLASLALVRPWGARGMGRRPKPKGYRRRPSTFGCGAGSGDQGSPECGL